MADGLFSFRVTESPGLRNRGRFTSEGLARQRDRNAQMARRLQEDVAARIEQGITWRAESTGHLARITMAPENAAYDTWNVAVGNERFLDEQTGENGKYWRTFEQGSAATWRHPFKGTWLWMRGPKGHFTGAWTDVDQVGGRWHAVVSHEIEGRHAYRDAAEAAQLGDYAIQSLRQTISDILG